MKFYIETERLILREVLETDVDGFFELDSDPLVHKYLGNKPIKTKEEAKNNLTFIREQYKEHGIGRFAVIEKSSGNFTGWSGLKFNKGEKELLNGFTNFIDIGYRLLPKYWGKGYATESSLACLEYGFKEMKYDHIYGAALLDNIASNKILKKIGLDFINEFAIEKDKANWYELDKTTYERKKLLRV